MTHNLRSRNTDRKEPYTAVFVRVNTVTVRPQAVITVNSVLKEVRDGYGADPLV